MTETDAGQGSPPVAGPAPAVGAPRDLLIPTAAAGHHDADAHARHQVEAVIASPGGGVLILGWIDDAARRLDAITVEGPGWRVVFDAATLQRRIRPDVAAALQQRPNHRYGYLGFVFGDRAIQTDGRCEVTLTHADGGAVSAAVDCQPLDDEELRSTLLAHIAEPGVPDALGRGLGDQIVRFNRALTSRMTSAPYVERFGGSTKPSGGSIVVCLYGRAEYHFVQNALFSAGDGIGDYEFIFVSNSPELADTLLDGARKAQRVYGLDQTLVLLPGNAGFGAANNAAARFAGGDRILIVNPDVLPRDPAWARRHGEIVATCPAQQSRLFGGALYYDDGSLMHGGMYFEPDRRVWPGRAHLDSEQRIHVRHHGKGAPADATEFIRPRPVPAVTGAFMSLDRSWFEGLGGFSEDYVLGHYEDADLCLKSLRAGTPAWMQDLRMWHLEGKSSPRLRAHEGAIAVNRWLFASRWAEMLGNGLFGPAPSHPSFEVPGA